MEDAASTTARPVGSSYEHSAYYTYIDQALRARWHTFRELEEQMASFVPKSVDEFAGHRTTELDRLRTVSPNIPAHNHEQFVDRQIALHARADMQFHRAFDERHMTEYVCTVMLAHALCEAFVNAVLAIGLARSGAAELFSLFERAELKQKWLVGPKSFAPTYVFPRGTGIHETLGYLCKQRNALVHHKIDLRVDGQKVLDGSGFKREPYPTERRWIRRFFSLPYDLAEDCVQSSAAMVTPFLLDRRPIERAHDHGPARH